MLGFWNKPDVLLTDNVKKLDKQIAELHAKYKASEFSDKKLKRLLFPVTQLAKQNAWKVVALKFTVLLVVVLAIFAGCYWKPANRFASGVAKKFMVHQVLPLYDWTWIWNEDCMFNNPYAVPEENPPPPEVPCEVCAQLKSLEKLRKVNSTVMVNTIFDAEPTLIVDATDEWPAITNPLSLEKLFTLYKTEKGFQEGYTYCSFNVTSGIGSYADGAVLDMIDDVSLMLKAGQEANFTAFWANCNADSSRALHKFYFQPYFLPGMCEPVMRKNYVLAGKQSSTKTKPLSFEIAPEEKGYWIAQVFGRMEILLKPAKTCRKQCKSIQFILETGEILNVPSPDLYSMIFRPASKEAVAFGVSYNYY